MTPVISHDTCPPPLSVAASGPQTWSSKMLQVEAVSSATTSEAPECHYPPRLKGKGQRSPRPMKECHSPLKAEHVGSETKLFSAPRETGKQFHSLSSTYCIPLGRSLRRCPSAWPLCVSGRSCRSTGLRGPGAVLLAPRTSPPRVWHQRRERSYLRSRSDVS